MNRRTFVRSALLTTSYSLGVKGGDLLGQENSDSASRHVISVRPTAEAGDLPHFWEECVGSDRAAVGLRQQWLSDLERTKRDVGVKSVRFHGLFNEEMGVWPAGAKSPNFLYVDTVFDAMLERGIHPLVELSFMPVGLASGTQTAFFYRGNATPPKDMAQWGELVKALATHCIDRYGIEEVAKWNFEVWNEPNLRFFWSGTQQDYFELYKCSAKVLKSINARLRVGGPSTAQTAWIGDMIEFCSAQDVPLDFISTHIYPDDIQSKVFGEGFHYPFEEVIPRALEQVDAKIKTSKLPKLPLYITEWSSQNPAFIAHTMKGCRGLAEVMSYWTFDSVYEELGIAKSFLNNSFGLIGNRGVPRPSFYTFALLHKLGEKQVQCGGGPILATSRPDGSLAIMIWNLIPQTPGVRSSSGDPALQTSAQYSTLGKETEIVLRIEGEHRHRRGSLTRVDDLNGNFVRAYKEMGSPAYPTTEQIEDLKKKSEPKPEPVALSRSEELTIVIPANGVALLEL